MATFITSAEIEQVIKSVVAQTYPQMASRGMLNRPINSPSAGGSNLQVRETAAVGAGEYLMWGTALWGGKYTIAP